MIYLILKMFVYLLLSLGLGAAAGWLWRNRQAVTREDMLERMLVDARSRLPQMDTTLRSRDDRIAVLERELYARDESLEDLTRQLTEREHTVAELNRQCADLQSRLDSVGPAPETSQANHRDDGELVLHSGDPHEAAAATDPIGAKVPAIAEPATQSDVPAAAVPVPPATPAAALPELDSQLQSLEQELAQTRQQRDDAVRELTVEQRRVAELTRERELQARSLRALEQQLELAREDAGEDTRTDVHADEPRSASG